MVVDVANINPASSSRSIHKDTNNWVVVSNMFYFHPYLGKIPILTNIFQMGWNQGLNYHYFHMIGDGHQPNSRGL